LGGRKKLDICHSLAHVKTEAVMEEEFLGETYFTMLSVFRLYVDWW
jgi:hypothetical protein